MKSPKASNLVEALEKESLVYITTHETSGKQGTVPVWFVSEKDMVYISTGPNSVKVRRLRSNPKVRLNFGRKNGPSLEGTARFCKEEELIRRIVPIMNHKYGSYHGTDQQFISQLLQGRAVLLEIKPSK
jgi:PPOX class probable F420-dependent enzyme